MFFFFKWNKTHVDAMLQKLSGSSEYTLNSICSLSGAKRKQVMNVISPRQVDDVLVDVASEVRPQTPKQLLVVRRRIAELLLREIEEDLRLLRRHDGWTYFLMMYYLTETSTNSRLLGGNDNHNINDD